MPKSTARNLIDPKRVKELMRDGGKTMLTGGKPSVNKESYIEELGVDAAGFVVNFLVDITPKIAADWLKKNPMNRKPSNRKVCRYAQMMKDGQFDLNGESVKFSTKGNLLDGQSRLSAIVMSGKTMLMEVRIGLPAKVQQTMDTGENRKLAHELEMNGYKNACTLSSVIRTFHYYLMGKGVFEASSANTGYYFTNRQGLDLVKRHPLIEPCALYCADVRIRRILPAGKMGALRYIFMEDKRGRAETFFSKLKTGADLSAGDPVLSLRSRILTSLEEGEPLGVKQRMALVIKAWNAYRVNKRLTHLTTKRSDLMPKIDGSPFLKS